MSQPHGSARLLERGGTEGEERRGVTHVYCALTSFTISEREREGGEGGEKLPPSSSVHTLLTQYVYFYVTWRLLYE